MSVAPTAQAQGWRRHVADYGLALGVVAAALLSVALLFGLVPVP